MSFLPSDIKDDLVRRSAVAATFAASLELVRNGQAEIRQDQLFGPIFFRSREGTARQVSAMKPTSPEIKEMGTRDGHAED